MSITKDIAKVSNDELLPEAIFFSIASGKKKGEVIKELGITDEKYAKVIKSPEYMDYVKKDVQEKTFDSDLKRLKLITKEGGLIDQLSEIIENSILPAIREKPMSAGTGVAAILNTFMRSADSLATRVTDIQINIQNNYSKMKKEEKDFLVTGNAAIDSIMKALPDDELGKFFNEIVSLIKKYEAIAEKNNNEIIIDDQY